MPNEITLELEAHLLGSIMLDEGARQAVAPILLPGHFLNSANGDIYEAIQAVASPDVILVANELGSKLEFAGGLDYLWSLSDYGFYKSEAEHYANEVRRAWVKREMATIAHRIVAKANDPDCVVEDLELEVITMGLLDRKPAPVTHFGDVDTDGEDDGVPTAFVGVNRNITTGGWPSGQLSVVRAYHKTGKTSFMISDFVKAAQDPFERPLYCTFADLNARQLKRRMLRQLCGWSKRPFAAGTVQDEFDRAVYVIKNKWQGYVYDASALDGGYDVETFTGWLKNEHRKNPYTRVYCDYAQKMGSSNKRVSTAESEQSMVASRVARTCAQTGLPIIVGSQMTEGVGGAKSKTKHSRAWEEEAGLVLALEREGEYQANLTIEHSRFGPGGIIVPLLWDKTFLSFRQGGLDGDPS